MRDTPTDSEAPAGALAIAWQTLLNRALRYAPAASLHLSNLAGRTIQLDMQRPRLTFYWVFEGSDVRVCRHIEDTSDCRIEGTLAGFLQLLAEPERTPAQAGVTVAGDVQLLQQLRRLVREADCDWEAPIAECFGDYAGPLLSRSLRAGVGPWVRSARKLPTFLAEYLSEETRALVGDSEARILFEDISRLRSATDRLQARINQLEQAND